MRIIPHANVINFQASIREMTAPELERLLKKMIMDESPMMAGALDMEEEAVYVYGTAESFTIDEERDQVELTARSGDGGIQRRIHPFSQMIISHEVRFDIQVDDRENQVIRYPVYYATFEEEKNRELTLFLAPSETVSHPLECVVEFWNQAGEAGRDVVFHESGCRTSSDFSKSLKSKRS